jgi:hypothetical protein
MICMSMKQKIFSNFHVALIVTKDHIIGSKLKIQIVFYNLRSQVHSLTPSIKAWYSASIEERVIVGYYFEHHVMTLIPILNTYLVVECQLSLSPTQSTLVCPLSKLLDPFKYSIPKSIIPFTYLKICFITSRWAFWGVAM